MKRSAIALLLSICLMFSGCSTLLTGEFIWEQEHNIPSASNGGQGLAVSDYAQLYAVMADSIEQGTEVFTVSVAAYDSTILDQDVQRAAEAVRAENPIAAYAVSDISCQIGTVGGEKVLVVQVQYLHHSFLKFLSAVQSPKREKLLLIKRGQFLKFQYP